ncbi:hypothetical protein BDY21DRAFT_294385 [Lineolata rhizophorae]|uniref:C2H2-type domain-containing protein n=1 Tax=Lineolata rhizophorae TaxID=578093 RepID=A0A6A6NLN4_9PEZI|nr:hypothetical protein BDY21DRAFT_294385 [Lineolata rhizophorae]
MSPNEEKQLDDSNQPGSPRNRGHSYKREEDPPQNAQGKFLCAQCKNLLFDRRCEWNKHMDKHERPYHCSQKGCEKLQGFTYSGGLLRHEREVHKMHGTNKALFCKFPDCKRSSGVGFTRKENLQEHIRRVHRRPSQAGVDNGDVPSNDDAASPDAAAAVPERKPSPGAEKRKRHSYTGSYGHEDGGSDVDVREEMKRLRRENKALRDDMESFRREIGAIQGKIATLRGDDR